MTRKYSDNIKEKALQLVAKGHSIPAAARAVKANHQSVRLWVRKSKMSRSSSPGRKRSVRDLIADYERKLAALRELSKELGEDD